MNILLAKKYFCSTLEVKDHQKTSFQFTSLNFSPLFFLSNPCLYQRAASPPKFRFAFPSVMAPGASYTRWNPFIGSVSKKSILYCIPSNHFIYIQHQHHSRRGEKSNLNGPDRSRLGFQSTPSSRVFSTWQSLHRFSWTLRPLLKVCFGSSILVQSPSPCWYSKRFGIALRTSAATATIVASVPARICSVFAPIRTTPGASYICSNRFLGSVNKNSTVFFPTNSPTFSIFRAACCIASTSGCSCEQLARNIALQCSNAWEPHASSNSLFRTFVSARLMSDSSVVTIDTRPRGGVYVSAKLHSKNILERSNFSFPGFRCCWQKPTHSTSHWIKSELRSLQNRK